MSMIYEVRAQRDSHVHAFGARRTRREAEILLHESQERVDKAGGTNDRYWIEEIDVTGLFEIPSTPAPRDQFTTAVERLSSPGEWHRIRVKVLDGDRVVASYERNHAMLDTFEPFRQGGHAYALVSTDYTATSVMDLHTGEIIAGEEPDSMGFCPVGFYVPDWWDVHDDSTLPGSTYWTPDHEWPTGSFGFVWGCVWGDDSSWKVQYLDLSRIRDGILRRDDRFGYIKLAMRPGVEARDVIRCQSWQGKLRVEFALEETFDISTGKHLAVADPFA